MCYVANTPNAKLNSQQSKLKSYKFKFLHQIVPVGLYRCKPSEYVKAEMTPSNKKNVSISIKTTISSSFDDIFGICFLNITIKVRYLTKIYSKISDYLHKIPIVHETIHYRGVQHNYSDPSEKSNKDVKASDLKQWES